MMVDFMGSVIVAKFGFLTFQGLTTLSQLFKHPGTKFYLVEVSSALLLVAPFSHGDSSATFKFKVVELDVIKGDFKQIKTLGDSAIFLGSNAVISIDASKFAEVEPSHIYFTDDWCIDYHYLEGGGGRDMGAYNLKDGKIKFLLY
ncbi:putative GDSL esterase/lipase-like [Capsicum annuum]|nr:putative GDSL esterase/lipase-like [Capsicum annuum]